MRFRCICSLVLLTSPSGALALVMLAVSLGGAWLWLLWPGFSLLLVALNYALLGAAALGDIGRHFPDTDAQFRGADSAVLLAEALRAVQAAGWQLVNVDSTVVAQAPRLAPHREAMRQRVAQVLGLAPDCVNIKAKTAEKLGPVGQGLAIEARAVVLLQA